MDMEKLAELPGSCPGCRGELVVTRLHCDRCGTDVTGRYEVARLVNIPEPFASVLEMFLKVRGNVKEMERQLGLSYPTVRARLEEAFEAAGLGRDGTDAEAALKQARLDILKALNDGAMSAADAAEKLKDLKSWRQE